MKDKKTEQMKEYLRIKEIEEKDKSDEIIDEVYNRVTKKDIDNYLKER